MKGAILILVVMLVFSLAFSQQEEGAGEADSTKADTSEVDTVEVDSLEADTLEIDTLQTDTLKTETPGADTVQVDTSKVETPEVDTLKAESPEPDTLKADSLEVDTLKVEIPGADTLRADSLEVDTLMADTLQADTTVEETPKVVVHKYIGTNTCMLCHNSVLKGRMYNAWDTTKHATAYVTLANQQSKAIAEEMGIEDAQQDERCLKCHVTGYGLPATDKYSMEEGVTCEACHGPGENYDDIRVMTKPDLYEQSGMIVPDEELCVTCHNQESPTYREFKYKDAFKLIEHRTPEHDIKDVFDLD